MVRPRVRAHFAAFWAVPRASTGRPLEEGAEDTSVSTGALKPEGGIGQNLSERSRRCTSAVDSAARWGDARAGRWPGGGAGLLGETEGLEGDALGCGGGWKWGGVGSCGGAWEAAQSAAPGAPKAPPNAAPDDDAGGWGKEAAAGPRSSGGGGGWPPAKPPSAPACPSAVSGICPDGGGFGCLPCAAKCDSAPVSGTAHVRPVDRSSSRALRPLRAPASAPC